MSSAESWSIFLHTSSNCIGLLGNGLLLYLVLAKTPKNIQTYSVLMFNFALTDFCGCLTAIFVQQRIIPIRFSLAYISSGPCKYFGPMVCYVSYSIMLHCYAHTLWSLVLSFFYRYLVLKGFNPTKMMITAVLLAFYSISLFQCIVFSIASDDPTEMVNILHDQFPSYELTGNVVSGNKDVFEWKTLFTILHMTLPVSPVYSAIFWFRRNITKILNGHSMSENTRAIHRQLLNALTFQAILPGLFFLSVITYAIGQLGIYNHPILEYSTFLLSGFIPVLSALGTLYFVRPYNTWIKRKILRMDGDSSQSGSKIFKSRSSRSSATNF